MKKYIDKVQSAFGSKNGKLDPQKPEERKEIIREAVQRTVEEYGEALKRLGSD